MSCPSSSFECYYCANSTIGPLSAVGYTLTPCFEATLIVLVRAVATLIVISQICHTCSLPSLNFLRSRVAFESSRQRRARGQYGKDGNAVSSIASGSVASFLNAGEDVKGAFKMREPLLDDMGGGGDMESMGNGSGRHRRKSTTIHQEAALARFPGVPAPRPGPLKRGDPVYLQVLRQSLQADKRDNEGACPRIMATFLLVLNLVLSVLLFTTLQASNNSMLLPPHVISLVLQCLVWSGSLVLIFFEWKKGIHTSGFLRSVWVCMLVAVLISTYDDIAMRMEVAPTTNGTHVNGTFTRHSSSSSTFSSSFFSFSSSSSSPRCFASNNPSSSSDSTYTT